MNLWLTLLMAATTLLIGQAAGKPAGWYRRPNGVQKNRYVQMRILAQRYLDYLQYMESLGHYGHEYGHEYEHGHDHGHGHGHELDHGSGHGHANDLDHGFGHGHELEHGSEHGHGQEHAHGHDCVHSHGQESSYSSH
ncbi:zinc transporter 7-B-like [Penaeus indicus]|uniref:zinc transporter 7-B-like n=1 Tax=Penaeus indicus TaxID=29960 RepID=UPI00300D5F59